MQWLFAGGHVADLAIALALLEWLAIGTRHRRTGRGLSGGDVAGNLLAGIALLLALRAALTGGGAVAMACWLLVALLAHVGDLRRRWRTAPPESRPILQDRPSKGRR